MTQTEHRYNFKETESKWRQAWLDQKCFEVEEDLNKEKYYVLAMLPYPSGRIHVGHVRNYSLSDVIARYRKAQGFNVLNPMGWDALGLPAENAALERGVHPGSWTNQNIEEMHQQLKTMGLAIDWSREISTCDPSYYKHEQKMFIDFYKQDIAYRKESMVNWDPVENTVLANEQVVDGKGWRSGVPVERRKLNQWFLKITDYADALLNELKTMDGWPEKVRIMQENWIGKSVGLQFKWGVKDTDEEIEVFTTRPDTFFGASFVALAPDHPLAAKLAGDKPGFDDFIKECNAMGTSETAIEKAEKEGFDTGYTATHPLHPGKEFPIYLANFILMDYGTGAIFGVPAHDQRDFEFASKYDLAITPVVIPEGENPAEFKLDGEAYTGEGKLGNSDYLDGLSVEEAKAEMIKRVEAIDNGFGKTQFRLRDWGVSRQRYWGCPVPMIHCGDCGVVPVPDDQLPVELPSDVTFDKPGNPLDRHPTWKNVDCPECGKPAQRETDTFDTFFESSWYQFRYCDPKNEERGFAKEKGDYWMPVDQYIGGIEHAVMHLLYARFFTRALSDCGYTDVKEPFTALYTQGMVNHATFQDMDGNWLYPKDVMKNEAGDWVTAGKEEPVKIGRVQKMSKSKRNTIDPQDIMDTYGSDAARLFVLSDSPPDRDLEWTEAGLEGAWRYISRVYRMLKDTQKDIAPLGSEKPNDFSAEDKELRTQLHQAIKGVGEDIERFHMNKAVARVRELSNTLEKITNISPWVLRETYEGLASLLKPFTPHLAEELWAELGHSTLIAEEVWPQYEESLLTSDKVTIAVQVNGKMRSTITLPRDCDKQTAEETALTEENVVKFTEGKQIRKVIVVPNKIVNVVVG